MGVPPVILILAGFPRWKPSSELGVSPCLEIPIWVGGKPKMGRKEKWERMEDITAMFFLMFFGASPSKSQPGPSLVKVGISCGIDLWRIIPRCCWLAVVGLWQHRKKIGIIPRNLVNRFVNQWLTRMIHNLSLTNMRIYGWRIWESMAEEYATNEKPAVTDDHPDTQETIQ